MIAHVLDCPEGDAVFGESVVEGLQAYTAFLQWRVADDALFVCPLGWLFFLLLLPSLVYCSFFYGLPRGFEAESAAFNGFARSCYEQFSDGLFGFRLVENDCELGAEVGYAGLELAQAVEVY